MGLVPPILNFIGLVIYFISPWPKTAFPVKIILYPYIITFLFLLVEHFSYGMQHTTLSLARNYLLGKVGLWYNPSDVFKIQNIISPKIYIYSMITKYFLNVISFNLILFLQGWGLALGLYVISSLINTMVPINYVFYMKLIRQRIEDVTLGLNGLAPPFQGWVNKKLLDVFHLKDILEKYITNKTNIHNLYHKRMADLMKQYTAAEIITGEVAKPVEYLKTINNLAKSIELNPKDADAYYNRGVAYGKLWQYQKAIDDYTKTIELNPEFASAYYVRGSVYAKLGDQKAMDDYARAIELNPSLESGVNYNHLVHYNRGITYAGQREHQKAIDEYTKAIELNPQYVGAYYSRGRAYYDLEQYKEAEEDYTKAIELDPKEDEAYYARACAYRHLGQHEKAMDDLNKAMELEPGGYSNGNVKFFEDFMNGGDSYL